MTQNKDQFRAKFEAWYFDKCKCANPIPLNDWAFEEFKPVCMRPDGDTYKVDSARDYWEAWQAALSSEAESFNKTKTPTHAMYKRVFKHGVVRDWKLCTVEYANYILSKPERFGETEVKFLVETQSADCIDTIL